MMMMMMMASFITWLRRNVAYLQQHGFYQFRMLWICITCGGADVAGLGLLGEVDSNDGVQWEFMCAVDDDGGGGGIRVDAAGGGGGGGDGVCSCFDTMRRFLLFCPSS